MCLNYPIVSDFNFKVGQIYRNLLSLTSARLIIIISILGCFGVLGRGGRCSGCGLWIYRVEITVL